MCTYVHSTGHGQERVTEVISAENALDWPCIFAAPSVAFPMHRSLFSFRWSETSKTKLEKYCPVDASHLTKAITYRSITYPKIIEHWSWEVVLNGDVPVVCTSLEMQSWMRCPIVSMTVLTGGEKGDKRTVNLLFHWNCAIILLFSIQLWRCSFRFTFVLVHAVTSAA